MRLKSLRTSEIAELDKRAGAFVCACGYEHRSTAISRLISEPRVNVALCFEEWSHSLARQQNEKELIERGFSTLTVGANDSIKVQEIVGSLLQSSLVAPKSIAFDISSMTRAWHGAVVRQLRTTELDGDLETFFTYVPAKFKSPPYRTAPNEFVAPVDGFASLRAPDLPIAVIMGLGYEREKALGLQQLLDPQRTILMIPRNSNNDPFYDEVVKNNKGIRARTPAEWIFEYSLNEPMATFATLASILSDLRGSYRVVLASLGPKLFGVLCFLLATRFKDVSVWRVSSGVHGEPRDVEADLDKVVVLSATWEPSGPSNADSR